MRRSAEKHGVSDCDVSNFPMTYANLYGSLRTYSIIVREYSYVRDQKALRCHAKQDLLFTRAEHKQVTMTRQANP